MTRSADDAAGVAIAAKLREDIRRMTPARPSPVDPALVPDFPAFTAAALAMKAGALADAGEIGADLLSRYPNPPHAEAAYICGLVAWWAERDTDTALKLLHYVTTQRPNVAEYHYNLGFVLQRTGQDEAAISAYERALALEPGHAGALVNLGNGRLGQGNPEAALACYNKAAGSGAADPLAKYNRAIAHFLLADPVKGWADYEHRFSNPDFLARHPLPPISRWDGTPPPAGARLLVAHEQGFGDTIMVLRYADELRRVFGEGNVVWAVPPSMVGLLRLAGEDAEPQTGDVPYADLMVPTMSLPHLLGHPTHGRPYLFPVPPEAAGRRQTVGYVWAGSDNHEADRKRSTERADWDPLLATEGLTFLSLQVGRGGDFAPRDWSETVERLDGIDLVITVDTAVAHLAGAMGIPTWILLPAVPDFRWGMTGDRTVWYDSARLYRQARSGEWGPVFARVQAELVAWRDGR